MQLPDLAIQPACRSDIHPLADLWSRAFPGRRDAAARAAELERGGRYGGLDDVLVARHQGRLAAACRIYRLTQVVAGREMPVMGLAAVAVEPHFRRRGIGATLCTHAINAAADRGDVIGLLYPFRPDYYERLGWGLVGRLHRYRFSTGDLLAGDYTRAGGTGARGHPAAAPDPPPDPHGTVRSPRSRDDRDAIARCYARVAARSNGLLLRRPPVWESLFRHSAVVVEEDGVRGYALLHFRAGRRGGPGTLLVRELVAEDDVAYDALLAHLAGLADEWPQAVHFARPEERFGDRLRDPRPPGGRRPRSRGLWFPTATIIRGPMARLLDVPGALRRRHWFDDGGAPAGGCSLRIATADSQRPANDGAWVVRIAPDGSASVETAPPGDGGQQSEDAALLADPSALARLYVGELDPLLPPRRRTLRTSGDVNLLARAFATRESFRLLDEF